MRTEVDEIWQMAELPKISELKDIYLSMAKASGKKVIYIRLLDRQKDKKINVFAYLPYDNSHTGFNFYRSKEGRELALRQIAALIYVHNVHPNAHISVPQVSTPEDLAYLRELVAAGFTMAKEYSTTIKDENFATLKIRPLVEDLLGYDNIGSFIKEGDVQVGMNDFTKSVLNISDRDDPTVSEKLSSIRPEVLVRIARMGNSVSKGNRNYCLCGSFAGQPGIWLFAVSMAREIKGLDISLTVPEINLFKARYYLNEWVKLLESVKIPQTIQKILANIKNYEAGLPDAKLLNTEIEEWVSRLNEGIIGNKDYQALCNLISQRLEKAFIETRQADEPGTASSSPINTYRSKPDFYNKTLARFSTLFSLGFVGLIAAYGSHIPATLFSVACLLFNVSLGYFFWRLHPAYTRYFTGAENQRGRASSQPEVKFSSTLAMATLLALIGTEYASAHSLVTEFTVTFSVLMFNVGKLAEDVRAQRITAKESAYYKPVLVNAILTTATYLNTRIIVPSLAGHINDNIISRFMAYQFNDFCAVPLFVFFTPVILSAIKTILVNLNVIKARPAAFKARGQYDAVANKVLLNKKGLLRTALFWAGTLTLVCEVLGIHSVRDWKDAVAYFAGAIFFTAILGSGRAVSLAAGRADRSRRVPVDLPGNPYASSPISVKSINANNDFIQQALAADLRRLEIRSSAAAVISYLANLFKLRANGITTGIWSQAPPFVGNTAITERSATVTAVTNKGGSNGNKIEDGQISEVRRGNEEFRNAVRYAGIRTQKARTAVAAGNTGYAGKKNTELTAGNKFVFIKRLLTQPQIIPSVAGKMVAAIVVFGSVMALLRGLTPIIAPVATKTEKGGVLPCATSDLTTLNSTTSLNSPKTLRYLWQRVKTGMENISSYSLSTTIPAMSTPETAGRNPGKNFLAQTAIAFSPVSSLRATATGYQPTRLTAPIINTAAGAVVSTPYAAASSPVKSSRLILAIPLVIGISLFSSCATLSPRDVTPQPSAQPIEISIERPKLPEVKISGILLQEPQLPQPIEISMERKLPQGEISNISLAEPKLPTTVISSNYSASQSGVVGNNFEYNFGVWGSNHPADNTFGDFYNKLLNAEQRTAPDGTIWSKQGREEMQKIAKDNGISNINIVPAHKKIAYGIEKKETTQPGQEGEQKGDTPKWSNEVFEIYEIDNKQVPVMYLIKDYKNGELKGKFYNNELQVSQVKDFKEFEKIVKTKTENRIKKYYVSFKGLPEKFNIWVDGTELKRLKVLKVSMVKKN